MAKNQQTSRSLKPLVASAVIQQVGGQHYAGSNAGTCPHCGGEIQHWDLFADMPYLEGAATSYVPRWREKGGLADLRKAISFLQKRIALEELKLSKNTNSPVTPPK